jgi:hypothetical protein
MSGFLYYLARGADTATPAELIAAGLGYAFAGPDSPSLRGCTGGPDGGRGVVAALGAQFKGAEIGYFPDRQNWRRIPESVRSVAPAGSVGDVWVGFYTAALPTPEELRRPDALTGHAVELGDGRGWVIPVARAHAETDGELVYQCALPRCVGLDESGEWSRESVVPRYARLWSVAERWWAELGEQIAALAGKEPDADGADGESGGLAFDFPGAIDAAIECLATNYRVGPAEVAALGLLTDQNVAEILNAVVDWPTWVAWRQKKTTGGSDPTCDGSPGGDGRPVVIDRTGPQ